jgi:hypothetical protein
MLGSTMAMKYTISWCASVLLVLLGWRVSAISLHRTLEVLNESGENLIIEWFNPKTGKLVSLSQNEVPDGAKVSYNSFVNHTFIVHRPTNGTCSSIQDQIGSCSGQIITVTENQEQGKGREE